MPATPIERHEAGRPGAGAPQPERGATSFWLDQPGARPCRPSLEGDREADVCIVGGGFTGLWTAYELRRAAPSLEVVVLESRYVGFGASGRNGGWVLGALSGSPAAWRSRGGPAGLRAMVRAIQATVGEIGGAVEREGIGCDWKHGGSLTVAQSEIQLARLRAEVADQRAGLTLRDGSHLFSYSQRTADGRIAIGGRGVPYRFGSRTDREGPVPSQTITGLRERLGTLFAPLRDVPVARAWHGVLGVSRDWCPAVHLDRVSGLGFAGGYAGEGWPPAISPPELCGTWCSTATPISPGFPGWVAAPATGSSSPCDSRARGGSMRSTVSPTARSWSGAERHAWPA